MTRFSRTLPAIALALTFATNAFAAGDNWTADYEGAKQVAASKGKDILMDFTGSDWCPPCKRLQSMVFDSDTFKKGAPEHFVLLVLDFPRDKSKMKPKTIKQNDRLKEEYPIGGYPTIFLADAAGRPYYRAVGYPGTPADAYLSNLIAQKKVRVERDALFKKAAEAEGEARAKLLDEALSKLPKEVVGPFYLEQIEMIVKADAEGKLGLKDRYEKMLFDAQIAKRMAEIQKVAKEKSPAAAVKAIDEMVKELKPTGESLQQVLYIKGFFLYQTDKAASKQALQAALDAAPNSPSAPRLRATLTRAFPKEAPKEEKKEDAKKPEKE